MTLETRPVPGLFGGVSQRIPAMRHPTQCSEQRNGIATTVDGLYKRPGLTFVKQLDLDGANGASIRNSFGNAFAHHIDKAALGSFELIIVNGNLMVFNKTTGAAQTVSFPNGKAYLNSSDPESGFRCVTVADYTFVVNTSVVTAMLPATDPANPVNVAYVNIKTAVPEVAYKITIGTTTCAVTTPPASSSTATADTIITQFLDPAALPTAFPGYTITRVPGTNIIKFVGAGPAFTATVSDGWGNTAMQSMANGVQKYSDLPPVFEAGYTITITGTPDSPQDSYYVKWDGAKWVETKKPQLLDSFNPATMPHKLVYDEVTHLWSFDQVATWDTRKVGDDDTNPLPSFVGFPLREVFFFRNRLGFLASDSLSTSRAGKYFNFFGTTATQILDSDPIDLASTAGDVETLDWAVVYNQTLLVFASTKQQFVLVGGDILSPNNARLMPSTTFEAYEGACPQTIGNQVVFTADTGSYCQLFRYRVSTDTVTNSADLLTEHVPRYIAASPRKLAASTATKMVAMVPRGIVSGMKLLKYEQDEQDNLTQKAWAELAFDTAADVRVINASWLSSRLYLTLHVTTADDVEVGGRFELVYLDLQTDAADAPSGIPLCLDWKLQAASGAFDGAHTTYTLPRVFAEQVVALRCLPDRGPEVIPVTYQRIAGSGTLLTVDGDQTDATLWVGIPFNFVYTPTEVHFRDQSGVPVLAASVTLKQWLFRYEDSGWFQATVTNRYRQTYTYDFPGFTPGVEGSGADQLGLMTDIAEIPVGAAAAGCKVSLVSTSHLPCKFPYAEWVGDVNMKARR
jgi:hypothetical protein